ncbi:DUF3667 domain-containing protein [Sphingomonas hylomeconis]|uniref:DUF3667 domain-containing protein n=1 Tax=Sphingomonas hylomeconis TaxID=1395958 RepID=A0ABV7STI7_9SPHN|nr:DUF3667 domain-containing protein [Sphingomonas hylomeconis]
MTGGIEAVGDIATGTMLGRAVEPCAGDAHMRHADHGLCLNCGTALIGDYCHACGQAEHVHRTLGSIGHDLLHGVFHFEGKIWRTLPMLVFHPGDLTRRYIAGERARFVSPLALFLFMVFLMFASIHTFNGDLGSDMPPAARASAIRNIDKEIADTKARLAQATVQPRAATSTAEDLQRELAGLQTARSVMSGKRMLGDPDFAFSNGTTPWPALNKGLAKANANPGLMLYKLQSSAYKYSWALIPISTPFVALLFLWRRRYKLYDHAIFVTYSLAFMMIMVVVLSGMIRLNASETLISSIALLLPPLHMFVQLRGAYELRKRSALWRTIALISFAWIALLTFVMLLLAVGLSG